MKDPYKKVFGGLVALLFVVTIVQSRAIIKLTDNASSNKVALSELATMQQAQVTATKTDSSAKRADGIDTGIYADEGKKEDETVKEVTITCTPAGCDNGISLPYTFQYDDTIDVKYCGGGGGGGGGGRGYDIHDSLTNLPHDHGQGFGGGGGGGGSSGQCRDYSFINVQKGQVVSSTIGTGGNGGSGSVLTSTYNISQLALVNPVLSAIFGAFHALPDAESPGDFQGSEGAFSNLDSTNSVGATSGGYGLSTTLNINGAAYPAAAGGAGGIHGTSAGETFIGMGGAGANPLLPSSWHSGANGQITKFTGFHIRGGGGGDGESPAAGSATSTTGSAGGNTATIDGALTIANNGFAGKLSYGGGGGSGGYGDYWEQFGCGNGPDIQQGSFPMMPNPLPDPLDILPDEIIVPGSAPAPADLYEDLCRILKGGNGGKGGDGYVKLIGVKIPPPTEAKFTTAGTHTFNWNMVPVGATVTIKVWGAGGGGGNAYENSSTTVEDIVAAGGGAGGYAEHQMVNPGNGVVPIIIGEGGAPGNMGGGNGIPGGQSKFGTSIVANGGLGGVGDVEGNQNSGVIGGAGGVAWGGSVTNTTGPAGQSGTAGGLGGNVSTPQNDIADGGQGGIINNAAGNNLTTRNALAGKPGRVEISW